MSTDPQPFEEDLEAIEPQPSPEETAQPEAKPGKKARQKKPKKEKVRRERPARQSSGGFGLFVREQFPDVYTALLGIAAVALIIAVILLAVEFFVRYGGERRPTNAMASPPAAAQTVLPWRTA